MKSRPLPVTFVSGVYIVMGAVGFIYHATELQPQHPFDYDFLLVEVIRLIAIVCGVYMLRARNWARWLALAWIGYHVILSAFHSWQEMAMHAVFFALIAYLLFRASSARYFRRGTA